MDNRDRKPADEIDLESPLGVADEPIRKTESDHLEGGTHTSRRRRARALGEDGLDRHSTGSDTNIDPDGAAGIDMGYGGEGTDVKPSR